MTKVVSKIISQGRNRWKLNENGSWSTIMWGWWPNTKGPQSRWVRVDTKNVPKEVKSLV